MELVETDISAKKEYSGSTTFTCQAGKSLELSYWNPGKIDELNLTVPPGKLWNVYINITINEVDA